MQHVVSAPDPFGSGGACLQIPRARIALAAVAFEASIAFTASTFRLHNIFEPNNMCQHGLG